MRSQSSRSPFMLHSLSMVARQGSSISWRNNRVEVVCSQDKVVWFAFLHFSSLSSSRLKAGLLPLELVLIGGGL